MDAIKLLTGQHRELEDLFLQLGITEGEVLEPEEAQHERERHFGPGHETQHANPPGGGDAIEYNPQTRRFKGDEYPIPGPGVEPIPGQGSQYGHGDTTAHHGTIGHGGHRTEDSRAGTLANEGEGQRAKAPAPPHAGGSTTQGRVHHTQGVKVEAEDRIPPESTAPSARTVQTKPGDATGNPPPDDPNRAAMWQHAAGRRELPEKRPVEKGAGTEHLRESPNVGSPREGHTRNLGGPERGISSRPGPIAGLHGAEKQKIFAQLVDIFHAHSTIEEQIFYPAARSEQTGDLVDEALEDHGAARRLIDEMRTIDVDDPVFGTRLKLLHEHIENHLNDEESELFPNARELLGPDRLDELGRQMEEKYRTLRGTERLFTYEGAPAQKKRGASSQARSASGSKGRGGSKRGEK